MTDEDIIRILGENSQAGIEGQLEAARIGAEASLSGQRENRQYASESADKAAAIYAPWSQRGKGYMDEADTLRGQGPPQYGWNQQFSYDKWKTPQTWESYAGSRLTPEGAKTSPYYGLYQFQKQQQDLASNKALAARGLYGSGAGMKQALNAQSGIDEGFAANEYNRALAEYQQSYNQSLQEHNIGYEEAKQKYGMSYDQYNKTFGVQQGQYQDKLNTLYGLGDYGWKADVGTANARIGQGTQSGAGAVQSGNAIASLYGVTGSGIGQQYNAASNQLLGLYGIQQGQQNYNNANQANLYGAGINAATGIARTGLDAYRYWNRPSTQPNYGSMGSGDPTYGADMTSQHGPSSGDYLFGD